MDPKVKLGPDVFKCETLIKSRTRKGIKEYFVKWAGYADKHNSWEPESNILDPALIASFKEKEANKSRRKKGRAGRKPTKKRAAGPAKEEPDEQMDEADQQPDEPGDLPEESAATNNQTDLVTDDGAASDTEERSNPPVATSAQSVEVLEDNNISAAADGQVKNGPPSAAVVIDLGEGPSSGAADGIGSEVQSTVIKYASKPTDEVKGAVLVSSGSSVKRVDFVETTTTTTLVGGESTVTNFEAVETDDTGAVVGGFQMTQLVGGDGATITTFQETMEVTALASSCD